MADSTAPEYTVDAINAMLDKCLPPWAPGAAVSLMGVTRDTLYKRWWELCAQLARTHEAITELLPREAQAALEAFRTYLEKIDAAIARLEEEFSAESERTPAWARMQREREAKIYALTLCRSRYAALLERALRVWRGGVQRRTARSRKTPPLLTSDADPGAAADGADAEPELRAEPRAEGLVSDASSDDDDDEDDDEEEEDDGELYYSDDENTL